MATSHATDIVINEALFVVRNYFEKTPWTTICSVLSSFYTDEEISEVKVTLMSVTETVDQRIDDLKSITPRTGGLKRKRVAQDMVQVFTLLDVRKVNLPTYVVFNVLCIPSFRPEDVVSHRR
jgi:hypothetical protein